MAITDVIFVVCLIVFIPIMVNNYLEKDVFDRAVRLIVMAGGGLWMLFSCYHEIIYSIINLKEGDAFLYERWAHEDIIPQLRSNNLCKRGTLPL